jgi:hypothetical protein
MDAGELQRQLIAHHRQRLEPLRRQGFRDEHPDELLLPSQGNPRESRLAIERGPRELVRDGVRRRRHGAGLPDDHVLDVEQRGRLRRHRHAPLVVISGRGGRARRHGPRPLRRARGSKRARDGFGDVDQPQPLHRQQPRGALQRQRKHVGDAQRPSRLLGDAIHIDELGHLRVHVLRGLLQGQ